MENIPQNVRIIGCVVIENVDFIGNDSIILKDSTLKNTTVCGATIVSCDIKNSKINSSRIENLSIKNSKITSSDLSVGSCEDSELKSVFSDKTNFADSRIENSDFFFSNISGCSFAGVSVSNSILCDISVYTGGNNRPQKPRLFANEKIWKNVFAKKSIKSKGFKAKGNDPITVLLHNQ